MNACQGRTAARLRPFGTTIFAEMSALAAETGAVNLGQGFPDVDGPAEIVEAAHAAMRSGAANQYAPMPGVPELRRVIAGHQRRFYGLEIDPDAGVQVTFGATEAIAAAMLGLVEPGDEVLMLEPYYDSYAAAVAMAGGVRRPVTLRPPDFALDADALRAAVSEHTRVVLLNSPHNPTGRVLTRDELEAVAAVCRERDLVAVTDEVYEHLVFDGEHVPLATLEGMAERTVTISSAGKTLAFTGWKIGWASGPAELIRAVGAAKQFLSFSGGTPLQHAVAQGLDEVERHAGPIRDALHAGRDRLCAGLREAGLRITVPQGAYFVQADVATDAGAWCRALPARAGVVAIPTGVFYDDPEVGRTLARFAFCKRPEVLDEAIGRLTAAL